MHSTNNLIVNHTLATKLCDAGTLLRCGELCDLQAVVPTAVAIAKYFLHNRTARAAETDSHHQSMRPGPGPQQRVPGSISDKESQTAPPTWRCTARNRSTSNRARFGVELSDFLQCLGSEGFPGILALNYELRLGLGMEVAPSEYEFIIIKCPARGRMHFYLPTYLTRLLGAAFKALGSLGGYLMDSKMSGRQGQVTWARTRATCSFRIDEQLLLLPLPPLSGCFDSRLRERFSLWLFAFWPYARALKAETPQFGSQSPSSPAASRQLTVPPVRESVDRSSSSVGLRFVISVVHAAPTFSSPLTLTQALASAELGSDSGGSPLTSPSASPGYISSSSSGTTITTSEPPTATTHQSTRTADKGKN
uniref:HDC06343 n=1 Tax=Drosophila melanogaster TaxID=7227 RepID=Q6IGG5_DROME|nr:TPA_inf: HDC06343 [Drosophila melanogaster]